MTIQTAPETKPPALAGNRSVPDDWCYACGRRRSDATCGASSTTAAGADWLHREYSRPGTLAACARLVIARLGIAEGFGTPSKWTPGTVMLVEAVAAELVAAAADARNRLALESAGAE